MIWHIPLWIFPKKNCSLKFQNKVHHQNVTINCYYFFLLQTRGRLGTGLGPCPGKWSVLGTKSRFSLLLGTVPHNLVPVSRVSPIWVPVPVPDLRISSPESQILSFWVPVPVPDFLRDPVSPDYFFCPARPGFSTLFQLEIVKPSIAGKTCWSCTFHGPFFQNFLLW